MKRMLKDTFIAVCLLASAFGCLTAIQTANAGCNNLNCSGGEMPCANVIGQDNCGSGTCNSGFFVCWNCTCVPGVFQNGRPDCNCI